MRIRIPIFVARSDARGASLAEAVIASAIVITVTAGVAHLLVWSRREAWSAGAAGMATLLAAQRLEQLRSLDLYVDASGTPVTDTSTNLSHDPPTADGGGLLPSPAGTLERNIPPYVDFLDAHGRWCGTGTAPSGRTAFVRRWSIRPAAGADDTLVLVVTVHGIAENAEGLRSRRRAARLQTLRTRLRQ